MPSRRFGSEPVDRSMTMPERGTWRLLPSRSAEGDEVAFESCSRRRLLDTSSSAPDGTVRTHAQTVIERCSP